MSTGTAITGTGTMAPEGIVNNEALCEAFNIWVRAQNDRNARDIAEGVTEALKESSPEFIEKVSGIRARHLVDATGVLDPARLCPNIADRPDDAPSVQAEMAFEAATKALKAAGRSPQDVDLVIVGSSSLQRPYPAIAIEVQAMLESTGFAYDMSVGCCSAVYAIQAASEAVRSGSARCALVCVPEVPSAYSNFRDRDSHFILGDAATAAVIEPLDAITGRAWEILSSRCHSRYSSNVRNNCGFLNRCDPEHMLDPDKLFYQKGRKVYRDIVQLVPKFLRQVLDSLELTPTEINRYWLHQANGPMNASIIKRLLGHEGTSDEAPSVLETHANTAAAGSLIALDAYNEDLPPGALGVLCAFGAGYTVGAQVLRRI